MKFYTNGFCPKVYKSLLNWNKPIAAVNYHTKYSMRTKEEHQFLISDDLINLFFLKQFLRRT
eukprot:UN02232